MEQDGDRDNDLEIRRNKGATRETDLTTIFR